MYIFTSLCVTIIVIAFLGIICIKKIKNNQLGSKLNLNELKLYTLKIFTYLCVVLAGFGDLYFKNNIPFISNKWNVIILLINGGVVILIIMGLSSYGIKYFIKKANLIKPISEQSKWKDQKKYISEKEKLSNMMKKSYSFACLGLIIPMLFVNVEVAVLWIIILAGGWLWFGTYDVESSMPKKFIINTVYKFNKKDWIFHSIMFLLLFVLMISVEYQSENTMDIILGIFGGMFFMGVLMMFLGNKLLKV